MPKGSFKQHFKRFFNKPKINNVNFRLNEHIKHQSFTLITDTGKKINQINKSQALKMAQEKDLDLYIVAEKNNKVVVKMLNYGKLRYLQAKKAKQNKKKQTLIIIKEIRMHPSIGDHDLEIKINKIKNFLQSGNKVKITVRFRGRELSHKDKGNLLLQRIMDGVQNLAVADGEIKKQYNNFILMLAPQVTKK